MLNSYGVVRHPRKQALLESICGNFANSFTCGRRFEAGGAAEGARPGAGSSCSFSAAPLVAGRTRADAGQLLFASTYPFALSRGAFSRGAARNQCSLLVSLAE